MSDKKDRDKDKNWAGKGFSWLNGESAPPKDEEDDE